MKVQIEISTPFAMTCAAVALIALAGAHLFGFVTLPVDTAKPTGRP